MLPLSSRLGPPGLFPVPEDCPELTVTAQPLESGYRETFEQYAITERKELHHSLTARLGRPASIDEILQEQQSLLDQLDGLQNQRLKVPGRYGPPLEAGPPHARRVPEMHFCTDEAKFQWLKELAGTVPLRMLEGSVPQSLGSAQLLPELCGFRVPLLRAAWVVKATMNAAVKPSEADGSSSAHDVAQRRHQWTRMITEHAEAQLPRLVQAFDSKRVTVSLETTPMGRLGAVIHKAFRSAGQDWVYFLSIFSQTHREGLVDTEGLAAWLIRLLKNSDASAARLVAVAPLLHLLLPHVARSQQLTRDVIDVCTLHLCSKALASTSPPIARLLRNCLWEALQQLLTETPHTFVALDIPHFDPATAQDGQAPAIMVGPAERSKQQPAQSTAAMWTLPPELHALGSSIIQSREALAATVQARVLGVNEAGLIKIVEDAYAEKDAETVIASLKAAIEPWRGGRPATAEIVGIICQWACLTPALDIALGNHAITLERASLHAESILGPKRIAALCLLRSLAKTAGHSSRQPGAPPLQGAITAWLDSSPAPLTVSLKTRQSGALLVQMVEAGIFCPGAFLQILIAHGLAPSPPTTASRHPAERPDCQCRVLEQLDPQLHIPSLQDPVAPPGTPGGEAPGHSPPGSQLLCYANTRAAVLERWRRRRDGGGGLRSSVSAEVRSLVQIDLDERPSKRQKRQGPGREESPSHLQNPWRSSLSRRGSLREGSPCSLRSSRLSGRWASLDFSIRDSPDTSGPASSASAGETAGQAASWRAVQAAIERSLAAPGLGKDTSADELLSAAANLRCWEQRLLVRWLNSPACLEQAAQATQGGSNLWVLHWLLALMEAAGGHLEALEWLLHQVDRCAASQGTEGCLLLPLCSMLASRQQSLSAAGVLPKLLDTCTLPALRQKAPGPSVPLRLASEAMRCYKDQPGVQGWWLSMQRLHGRHPVVKELEQAQVAAAKPKLQGQIQLVPASTAVGPLTQPKAICSPAVLDIITHFVAGEPTQEEVARLADCIVEWVAGSGAAAAMDCLRCAVRELVSKTGDTEPATLGAVSVLVRVRSLVTAPDAGGILSQEIAAACSQPHATKAGLMMMAVAAGLVDLQSCIQEVLEAAAGNREARLMWLTILLGPGAFESSSASPASAGMAAELLLLQRQLPLQLIWDQLRPLLEGAISEDAAAAGPGSGAAAVALAGHGPLQVALLSQPAWLQQRLAGHGGTPGSRPGLAPMSMLMSLLLGRLDCGPQGLDGAEWQSRLDARLASLLDCVTPAAQPLLTLLLRWHLDEQVMVSAMQKGIPAADALSRARSIAQNAQAGAAKITEEEKVFTSRVLAQLLLQPGSAAALARLTWALGPGLGEYLLQQVGWVLQDADTLLGHHSLRSVLKRRFGGLLTPEQLEVSEAVRATGFALEQGFADVALTCLSCSQAQQHREFAEQLVLQLRRLGEALRQAPTAGAASAHPGLRGAGGSVGCSDADTGNPPSPLPGAPNPGALPPTPGLGAGRQRRMALQAALTPGSAEGVQVAVWLRLAILPSLLPLVYADRQPDAAKNLRALLAQALVSLLMSTAVYTSVPSQQPDEVHNQEDGPAELTRILQGALDSAQEPLFDRVLELLHALLAGTWASWLRGDKTNLREVPAHDSRLLQQELDASSLPHPVKQLIQAALTAMPASSAATALKLVAGPPAVGSATLDPWALPERQSEVQPTCMMPSWSSEPPTVVSALEGAILLPRRP